MLLSLITPLIWILIAVTLGLSWWRGARAEQLGSTMVVVAGVAARMIHGLLPPEQQPIALLADEACLAFGLLIIAMKHVSPWLGIAMLLQATQFSLHAYYLVGEKQHDFLYKVVNNVNTVAILVAILSATLVTWRKRRWAVAK